MNDKLYIVMVGLPARGKSTIASKLKENLTKDAIKCKIFNNGKLRRSLYGKVTAHEGFYSPENIEGSALREKIALINISRAKKYINKDGDVAILDATNASRKRRDIICSLLNDHPVLFIECINENKEILEANILRKVSIKEFSHLSKKNAIESFKKRIEYYKTIYDTIRTKRNFIKIDSLNNCFLSEEIVDTIPFYDRIRDFLVTDTVKNLYLIRHGETFFNLENRIGGDSMLTLNGKLQAKALAEYFKNKELPVIFTSQMKRTIETAAHIRKLHKECRIIPLREFNEIDSGVCECMSYQEIKETMPEIYTARKKDKYNYVYPKGEGYATMKERIDLGIKKALYLSCNSPNIMIIGHRATNRMILSHFLFRRQEDVPHIYIPQDKFYHITATQDKKLFQLKRFTKN